MRGAGGLCEALKTSLLKHLDLEYNPLGLEGIKALLGDWGEGLSQSKLEHLVLNKIVTPRKGAKEETEELLSCKQSPVVDHGDDQSNINEGSSQESIAIAEEMARKSS